MQARNLVDDQPIKSRRMQTVAVISAGWLEFEPVVRISAADDPLPPSSNSGATDARSEQSPGQIVPRHQPARPSSASSRVGNRILLVDDDCGVRDSISEVLRDEGYFVTPAENGRQAVELAGRMRFDLALLDLNMPVMDGWDTFERLVAGHPTISIIIITARSNQLFMALNAGAGALLEKPMEIPVLLRTVKKLLIESAGQRIARRAGINTGFDHNPARRSQQDQGPAKS
jgi:CheY-like chemotaxis protein